MTDMKKKYEIKVRSGKNVTDVPDPEAKNTDRIRNLGVFLELNR